MDQLSADPAPEVEARFSISTAGLAPAGSPENADALRRSWTPWSEKDLEAIQDCDDFPCKVKLDQAEVDSMKKSSKEDRVLKFHSLVLERVGRYLKTQARKAYEIPGDPVDPWKLFEERGFKISASRPEAPVIYVRKLNFAPDKMLTIHQVLDRRVARTTGATSSEAVAWTRDVYTDHYFDSWGEWSSIHCNASSGELVAIQSLLTEMDLLKSKSIFAHAVFGKYRSAFEEHGKIYLDGQFERLKKAAQNSDVKDASPPKSSNAGPVRPIEKRSGAAR
jgi:hypothetical protein